MSLLVTGATVLTVDAEDRIINDGAVYVEDGRIGTVRPRAVADYAVVHELCNLPHMDHSPRFWAMVADVVPDYRERRRSLDALQRHLPL